jgi:hypothetical protein
MAKDKKSLLTTADDDKGDLTIKINENYAKRYEERKKKEELGIRKCVHISQLIISNLIYA